MNLFRHLLVLPVVLAASVLCAKITWVVGEGFPHNVTAVAQHLETILKEPINVVVADTPYLSAWTNNPATEEERVKHLNDTTLLISLSASEPEHLSFMALQAVTAQRDFAKLPPILIGAQKPVYKMSGLCNNRALQLTARMAAGAGFDFVALPKVWQQVYTDDTFYNDKVPKGENSESYIAAAGIALAIRGRYSELPRLPGIHTGVADNLIASIREGFDLTEDVKYAANFITLQPFDVRVGNTFQAVLFDGDFERAIGDALMRLAEADGRELTLHYTTDTTLETGLPALFRTAKPAEKMEQAVLYTRPAFKDNSGLTELSHLPVILETDGSKPGWMPFPLAVAEWTRRLPGRPVYDGIRPTPAAAMMFASMLYLKWTGVAVVPQNATQVETIAISIGLDTLLASKLYYAKPNAVFYRPLGENRYAFSLWRKPTTKVRLHLATDNPGTKLSEKTLEFTPDNYWTRQFVTTDGTGTLFWKVSTRHFSGQHTGARAIPEPPAAE